jgi:hypothetical protein
MTPPLPTVTIARSADDLRDACDVRAQAYGRHVPHLGEALAEPDELDRRAGVAVLLARDASDGHAVGTLRVQCATPGSPLLIERSLILPARFTGQRRAEVTRLAVRPGADPRVRLLLMKGLYLYSVANQIRWLVIGARSDSLIRLYRGLGFDDVLDPDDRVPLAHAGGLPHRILAFDVLAAERLWGAIGHGLYAFMGETYHPEIRLFEPAPEHGHRIHAGQPVAA